MSRNLYPVSELSMVSNEEKKHDELLLKRRLLEPFRASGIDNILRDKRSAVGSRASRAIMPRFKSLLSDMRKLTGVTEEPTSALKDVLDSSDLGIDIADSAFRSLNVSKQTFRDFLKVNDVYLHKFESFLRSGDLESVLRTAKSSAIVTEADKKLFSYLARDYPEKVLRDIDEIATITKLERPQLNITLGNIDKLSDSSLQELNHFQKNWKRYAGAGSVALVIGTVTVTDSWFKDALAARRGCWMVKTVNGKSTSCRVSSFTCGDVSSSTGNTQTVKLCKTDEIGFYNVTVQFMYIAHSKNGTNVKENLSYKLGVYSYDLYDKAVDLLRDKFDIIESFVRRSIGDGSLPIVADVCSLHHYYIEDNKIPYCRVCDSTADPKSTQFIDPKQLPENVTFKCVADPSLVDLLTDMAVTTGHNLWESVVSASSSVFKYLKYGALVTIILALVIAIYFIFSKFIVGSESTSFGQQQTKRKYVPLINDEI